MKHVSKTIRFIWLPSLALALLGWGFGGKRFPGIDAVLDCLETWLRDHTDYPSLVVAGATILVLWAGYQIWRYFFHVRKEKWRGRLLALLRKGVEIRNEGERQIKSRAAAEKWIAASKDWKGEVVREIGTREPNEAEDFSLIDWAPAPRGPIKTRIKIHSHAYEMHDYRLVKLKELTRIMRQPE